MSVMVKVRMTIGVNEIALRINVRVVSDSDDELLLLPLKRRSGPKTPPGRVSRPRRAKQDSDTKNELMQAGSRMQARVASNTRDDPRKPTENRPEMLIHDRQKPENASSERYETESPVSVRVELPAEPMTPRRSARLTTPGLNAEATAGIAPKSTRVTPGKRARSTAPEDASTAAAASTPKRRRARLLSEEISSRPRVHYHHDQHHHASPGVVTRSAREGSHAPVTRSHCELVKLELRSNDSDGAPYYFCIPSVSLQPRFDEV